MPRSTKLYLDDALRILDPSARDLAPESGARGFSQAEVRGVDEMARTVTAVVSTPNVDRYEEVVTPEAFRKWLPGFMRNPVLVAGHAYIGGSGEPTVIGQWVDLRITKDALIGTAKFMTDDPLAEAWWQRFRQGAVRAFSVGWITHAHEMRDFDMPDGTKRKLRVFTEVELIEISAVTIPANRESLVRAASAFVRDAIGGGGDDNDAVNMRDGGRLSNRQLSIATRALQPVIRKIIQSELMPLSGSALNIFIDECVNAALDARAAYPQDYGLCNHPAYAAIDDDDDDDIDAAGFDDDDENDGDLDMDAVLRDILRPKSQAG